MKNVVRGVKKMAQREGLEFVEVSGTGSGHFRFILSNGQETRKFIVSRTPSDYRAYKNLRARLRRFSCE